MDLAQILLQQPTHLLVILGVSIFIAYCVFGIAGFGAVLVAGPVLAHFLPMTVIVPLLALLDFTASITTISKDKAEVARDEIKRLVLFMLLGSLIGATLLLSLKADIIMVLLFGLLAIAYPSYAMMKMLRKHQLSPFNTSWAAGFGTIGGIFSAMFGSGGFIYSIYISSRLDNKKAIRATQSTLIGFSTLMRIIIFTISGIYSNIQFFLILLALLPILFLGLYCGRSMAHRLNLNQFITLINGIVIISGIFLVIRYLSL